MPRQNTSAPEAVLQVRGLEIRYGTGSKSRVAVENVTFEVQRGELVSLVGLHDHLNDYPWQLSGGMQQRVAIARALSFQPQLLLMDEPFASLDAQTRAELEDLTLSINERLGVTIVFITHDIDEAVYLADDVVVLSSPPSKVDQIYKVALPKPRDQVTTKSLPEYTRLRGEVITRIHQQGRLPAAPALAPDPSAQMAT